MLLEFLSHVMFFCSDVEMYDMSSCSYVVMSGMYACSDVGLCVTFILALM